MEKRNGQGGAESRARKDPDQTNNAYVNNYYVFVFALFSDEVTREGM
jgi:hypothetical protein